MRRRARERQRELGLPEGGGIGGTREPLADFQVPDGVGGPRDRG